MSVLTITKTAQEQAKRLLEREEDSPAGLRVQVVSGGCNGFKYKIGWDDPLESDDLLTCDNGLVVMIDRKSAAMLQGSTLEFHDSIERQGFEVQNPQSTGCCGCGESFCT